jgi:hypothetical protein
MLIPTTWLKKIELVCAAFKFDRWTWVMTRNARAEYSGRWSKRRVNRIEVLLANDYPEDIIAK